MMTVYPFHGKRFNLRAEAESAAVNEACAGDLSVPCNITALCPECQALAAQIESRLQRAFLAGQQSMQRGEDGNE